MNRPFVFAARGYCDGGEERQPTHPVRGINRHELTR